MHLLQESVGGATRRPRLRRGINRPDHPFPPGGTGVVPRLRESVGSGHGAVRCSGTWLRCQLHTHTTNSDGELSPDLLVRHFDWAGYDVLAITDHWVRTV